MSTSANAAAEVAAARDLLVALEVGTRKEDRKLTDALLSKHHLARPNTVFRRGLIDQLAQTIVGGPGVEAFFLDLASEVRPFALMLQEVFSFLSAHATTTERRASSMRVSQQGAARTFEFDLSAFPRETIEVLTRTQGRTETLRLTDLAKAQLSSNVWNTTSVWSGISPRWDGDFYDDGFFRTLSYANTMIGRAGQSREVVKAIAGPVLGQLAAIAQLRAWPELFPEAHEDERVVSSYMDDEYRQLTWSFPSVAGSVIDRADTVAAWEAQANRDANLGYMLEGIALATSLWQQHAFRRGDHRDWLAERLGMPFEHIALSDYLRLLTEEAARCSAALAQLVYVHHVESIELHVRTLIDFLRLPFWRDRWFLYELWTVTHVLGLAAARWPLRLVNVVSRPDGGLEWRLPGGAATSPIAVLEGVADVVECWTQRKTYHPETGMGLEPDLRLIRGSGRRDDLIIIENKDRLKPRRTEMEEILERYVTGTQAQIVWLVNYEEFTVPTHATPNQWAQRHVYIASHFRPTEIPAEFAPLVLEVLAPALGPSAIGSPPSMTVPSVRVPLTVRLTWTKAPQDLDLHAWVQQGNQPTHVFFQQRGQGTTVPYAQLDRDCQSSPGREELVIYSGPEEVEIAVHQFSPDGALRSSEACVEIRGARSGTLTLLVPTTPTVGRWWRICSVIGGYVLLWNEITTTDPTDQGFRRPSS